MRFRYTISGKTRIYSINVESKCSENIPAGIFGYALVLTKEVVSKSSDRQRHFDLLSLAFNFFIRSFFSL